MDVVFATRNILKALGFGCEARGGDAAGVAVVRSKPKPAEPLEGPPSQEVVCYEVGVLLETMLSLAVGAELLAMTVGGG